MNLNILGHHYDIVMHNSCDTANGNLGSHYGKETKIFINKDQSQSQKESTLLHEILEAINYHLQLNMKHDLIARVETGLFQVLKDNGLLKYDEFS